MITVPRPLPPALAVLTGVLLAVATPYPAIAQEEPSAPPTTSPTPTPNPAAPPPAGEPACAATGYLAGSSQERLVLRNGLAGQPVQQVTGVPLTSGQTWVVPDGSEPVIVIDSTAPLSGGAVSLAMAGQEYEVARTSFAAPGNRYVSNVRLPHLGPTVRSLGMTVDSGACRVSVVLSVDRSLWSTVAGAVAVAVTVLFGLLAVWVARRRKGGWPRRFLFAAPLALVAGLGQAVVLLEAGVVGPFDTPPWWAPAAGLGLAAVLPLTRWRRGAEPAPPLPAVEPLTAWQSPVHAPLGRFRVEAPFTLTEVAAVYRATSAPATGPPSVHEANTIRAGTLDGPTLDSTATAAPPGATAAPPPAERALVKLLRPERYGEPAARLRLEREARALSGWEHPNVLRLRETVSEQAGPPTLVFEDVEGAPLRRLQAGGGSLTGPQAVTIVLGVLSGLRAVHERELVHRDIRPENVWLDTRGRVLLAGFELAATGIEHQVAPEWVAPYASPEQRAGRALDGRSDLYSCGALLAELLTGRPAPPPPGSGLPEPLAAILARALAEDPATRPASALRFSAELWDAAEQAYGADWLGRGALAGAVVAYAAIGASVAGYALGAGAAIGTAGGAAAGLGAGTGIAGTFGLAPAASPALTTAAAPAATTGVSSAAGGGGPVAAVVNTAVVVAAGLAIAATAVLVNPEPAEARSVVITPDQARVIFVRTMAEAWQDTLTHLTETAQAHVEALLAEDESLAGGGLTEIGVGVPREQYEFPAWFVAWALIPFDGGTASVFARFERAAEAEPWQMTSLQWDTERLLPPAVVDEDGWLAPPPPLTALLVDPASLPEQYHDWLVRANESGEVGTDEVLSLRYDDTGMIVWFTEDVPFFSGEGDLDVSYDYEMSAGEVVTDRIPLADGTVHVTFTSIIRQTTYNTTDQRSASCEGGVFLFWDDRDPPGEFRWLAQDLITSVDAWIPVTGPAPPAATPPPGLEAAPVEPDTVLVEDWNYHTDNRDGEPC